MITAYIEITPFWSEVEDLADLPAAIVERLHHYFLTYKTLPGEPDAVQVPEVYDRAHAFTVVEASLADYQETFGDD